MIGKTRKTKSNFLLKLGLFLCSFEDHREVDMENLKMFKVKKLSQTASNPIAIKKVHTSNWNPNEYNNYSGIFKVFKSAKMQYDCGKCVSYNKRKSESSLKQ